ncbi:MAG: thioredoxin domain-containing protein [Candidatus Micrarchaeota archaeon]
MVLCFIALFVFGFLGIFSAKYRSLAKEALECFWTTLQFKPCQGTLEDRIRRGILSSTFKISPNLTKYVNRYFTLLSWAFVILFFASFAYSLVSAYNFYLYGNCNGPGQTGFCIFDPLGSNQGKFCLADSKDRPDPAYPANLGDHFIGPDDALVTLVEIGCFTCPYSKEAQPAVEEILKKYIYDVPITDNLGAKSMAKLRYVFKPFPLPGHAFSHEAAIAAECASEAGKYWEYHDLLFKEQGKIQAEGVPALNQLAQEAGIGAANFDFPACVNSGKYNATINSYFDDGVAEGVYGTPTFFINGKFLAVGPQTVDQLSKAIEAELAK